MDRMESEKKERELEKIATISSARLWMVFVCISMKR